MRYIVYPLLIIFLLSGFTSCDIKDSTNTTATQVTATEAKVSTDNTTTQDTSNSQGGSISAKIVEEVDDIVTNNTEGISTWMFIVGALIFGMIIPQPKFIKILW